MYTSGKAYGNLVLQATLPGGEEASCVAGVFLANVITLQQ